MQNTFYQRMTIFGSAMLAFSSAICAQDFPEEAMMIKASELHQTNYCGGICRSLRTRPVCQSWRIGIVEIRNLKRPCIA